MSATSVTKTAPSPVDAVSADATVDRKAGLSVDAFVANYRDLRRPVVLTDAARDWPAYESFTPNWFREHFADKMVRVRGQTWRLGDLLDRLETSTEDAPAPYPCKFEIIPHFPEILAAVSPRFDCSLPDRQENRLIPRRLFSGVNNLELFFGGPGGQFPYLHYDLMHEHAWITQLYGDKEFTVYAPDQEPLLYVNSDEPWQSSIENHHAPDYAKYPLFRQARSQKIIIHAGETLFLPCGWWHTARSLNTTISVAFDQLGPDNWADFRRDASATRARRGRPLLARALNAYLLGITPLLQIGERFGANRERRWGQR